MGSIIHYKKWVIAFDVHGGEQDKDAVNSFFNFCDQFKPDDRILGGDLWNFAALRKNASAEEKRDSLQTDYNLGCNFRDRFRPTKSLNGNHCERLWEWRDADCGPASDLCAVWCEEIEKYYIKTKCEWKHYSKRNYLPIGNSTNTFVSHGYSHGASAARNMALAFSSVGNVHFGHIHAHQTYSVPTMRSRWATSSGCLCKLDQDYNKTHLGTLAQEHGWAYGVWNTKTGEVLSWHARRAASGKFIIPSDIVTL